MHKEVKASSKTCLFGSSDWFITELVESRKRLAKDVWADEVSTGHAGRYKHRDREDLGIHINKIGFVHD